MTKQHNTIVIALSVIISVCIWIGTVYSNKKTSEEIPYTYKVFSGDKGWGYDILVNDRLIIHQDYMPALASKNGFPLQEQAEKTAQLVISKLKKGEAPGISRSELELVTGKN